MLSTDESPARSPGAIVTRAASGIAHFDELLAEASRVLRAVPLLGVVGPKGRQVFTGALSARRGKAPWLCLLKVKPMIAAIRRYGCQRGFEVAGAVGFGGRRVAGADVGLHGRKYQVGER